MSDLYDYEKDQSSDPGEEQKYDDFYLKLRRSVDEYIAKNPGGGAVLDMVINIPDFFYMLVKLAFDPQVPKGNKGQIVAALAYFLSPVDVIPDFIPGLGWLDDLYIALIVTDNLLNSVPMDVVKQYWLGSDDLVGVVKDTMDRLNDKLGAGAIRRILDKFKTDGEG